MNYEIILSFIGASMLLTIMPKPNLLLIVLVQGWLNECWTDHRKSKYKFFFKPHYDFFRAPKHSSLHGQGVQYDNFNQIRTLMCINSNLPMWAWEKRKFFF